MKIFSQFVLTVESWILVWTKRELATIPPQEKYKKALLQSKFWLQVQDAAFLTKIFRKSYLHIVIDFRNLIFLTVSRTAF